MLKTLRIKDYAIIENLEIDFSPGLNILTGSTGTGKSILIGALSLVLGEKADSDLIRTGASQSMVEAIFEVNKKSPLFFFLQNESLFSEENSLIVRREISRKAGSKNFVNDKTVSLSTLKSVGDFLVDLHGQHQHQSLLDHKKHIDFLDNFGNYTNLLNSVRKTWLDLKGKNEELKNLKEQEKIAQDKRELYSFQLAEIEKTNLQVGEEAKLVQEKSVLENVEKISKSVGTILDNLQESEDSVLRRLAIAQKELNSATSWDKSLKEQQELLENSYIQIKELTRHFDNYKDKLEYDPEKLNQIRERMDLLIKLKKKYGKSPEELIAYAEEIKKSLNLLENRSEVMERLEKEITKAKEVLKENCLKLSTARKKKALELQKRISQELTFLGMEKTRFEIQMNYQEDENGLIQLDKKKYKVDEKGLDQIEFRISPNIGEELKPLAKIASGGEISRVMLALKSALAEADNVSTLIFDEIDSGIGGEVAHKVGKKLKELSKSHQVLAITHLQQIASVADQHYQVFKEVKGERTLTKIKKLSREERVAEIARMLSGKKVTQLAEKQASQLLEEALD
ncbi:MAG: DNA repair protein RecN [candidate division Zixibacteria bacterium RBG-1]|nr:MAG: DNA repair protein RecN [candidate division Zixibacteria bacterium RBG-1]OGC86517.1 MAG: DNA repair protein RecN [candidate division Zixibacteria bacterium RBG_19FT_COMBO_42_43]